MGIQFYSSSGNKSAIKEKNSELVMIEPGYKCACCGNYGLKIYNISDTARSYRCNTCYARFEAPLLDNDEEKSGVPLTEGHRDYLCSDVCPHKNDIIIGDTLENVTNWIKNNPEETRRILGEI